MKNTCLLPWLMNKYFVIAFDERINESMKNLDLNGAIKELKEVAESNKEIMSK